MQEKIRYTELDIARGFGIVFMILVHTSLYFRPVSSKMVLFLGRFPAAPVFMFALGAGIVFSRCSSARELARRGIKLFVFSYLFNFFAHVLPHLLLSYYDGTMRSLWIGLTECFPSLLSVDILQFAGLAFLFFALMKQLKISDGKLALLSVLISGAGTVLRFTTSVEGIIPQAVVGLFWGTSPDISCFPFASWILFPAAGYLAARLASEKNADREKTFLYTGLISGTVYLVLSVIALLLNIQFANFGRLDKTPAEYYHMHLFGNVCVIAFVLAWISICHGLVRLLPKPVINTLCRWSKQITPIYVIHFVILNYLFYVIPHGISNFQTVVLSLGVLAASDLLASIWKYSRSHSCDCIGCSLMQMHQGGMEYGESRD